MFIIHGVCYCSVGMLTEPRISRTSLTLMKIPRMLSCVSIKKKLFVSKGLLKKEKLVAGETRKNKEKTVEKPHPLATNHGSLLRERGKE